MVDGSLHLGARYVTFALAVLGAAISAALLFVVLTQPQLIEEKLQSFAIAEVEDRAIALVGDAQASENGLLQALGNRLAGDAEKMEDALRVVIAKALDDKCLVNCGETRLGAALDAFGMANRIGDLRIGERTVAEFAVERYDATVAGLLADLATFGTANLIAFLTLIFLSIFRGKFGLRILPMTLLLTAYIGAAIYWYIFTQDWASAILFNNWAAGGYVATMCVVYFLLIDFTFFYGRITEAIFNTIATILSNAAPG